MDINESGRASMMVWQSEQTKLRIVFSVPLIGEIAADATLLEFFDKFFSFQLTGDFDAVRLYHTQGYSFETLDETAANAAALAAEPMPAHPVYACGIKGTRSTGETLLILEIASPN